MNPPKDEVWFYSTKECPYGVFSNFWECKIVIDGVTYPHSEAYYQAEKFRGEGASEKDLEYADLISKQNTGNKSAILARQKKPVQNYPWAKKLWLTIQAYHDVKLRSDWEDVKDDVMRKAVYFKFKQNPKLEKILLSTGNYKIFEHTHRDSYWADGHPKNDPTVHGDGKNMLGVILEEVRDILSGKRDVYDFL